MSTMLPTDMDGRALAQTIVDTLPEPLLILDDELRVVVASRSYYVTFKVSRQDVQGRPVYALGDGQWNSPELRALLQEVLARHTVIEAYEVEHDFAGIGKRTVLLNAREMIGQSGAHALILLRIEDVTARRSIERQMAELLEQKDVLLLEMQHRVANSWLSTPLSMHSPTTEPAVRSWSLTTWLSRIGSLRFPTMVSAGRTDSRMRQRRGSAPALSARSPSSSTLMWRFQ
jgi:hypothetical protein